jgi:Carboxypeptidase regulatory-like domain/TonB-dependent Receptor Plug Domain
MRSRFTLFVLAASFSSAFALPFVRQVSAQGSGAQPVRGTVMDRSGNPIGSAEVIATYRGQNSRQVRTEEDGRFEFPVLAVGATSITARRLGYRSLTLNFDVSAATAMPSVAFVLDLLAADVAPVIVNSGAGRLSEFYGHKASTSFGRFFEQADIEKRRGGQVSELFRSVPGVTIIAMNGIGNAIRVRGCQPTLWVDGIRVPGTEVDEVANPTDIAAIEVYTSTAGIPVEYRDRDTRACGVIVLWSKVR